MMEYAAVLDPMGQAIGKIAKPVVECIDVDGVVRRINVNSLLDRVDINALLDRVDVNRLLHRVDFDRVLERVDINDVIARSDLGAIVAQSTTGVFGSLVDTLRLQLVLVDLVYFRIAQKFCIWRQTGDGSSTCWLPPRPAGWEEEEEMVEDDRPDCPSGKMSKAVAVQGRCAGFFSKFVAMFIDMGLATLVFTAKFAIIHLALKLEVPGLMLFKRSTRYDTDKVAGDTSGANFWVLPLYCVFYWLWFFLGVSLVGQTPGMSIAGIKVVPTTENIELSARQAAIRTTLLPITSSLLPFLGAIGFFRKDCRMLHDIVAGTALVYCWDARVAELREKAEQTQLFRPSAMLQLAPTDRTEIASTSPSLVSKVDEAPAMTTCTTRHLTFKKLFKIRRKKKFEGRVPSSKKSF